MRAMTVILTAVLALGILSIPGANASGNHEVRFCRTSNGNGWSNRDVEQAIRCADQRWHVPGRAARAIRVAKCESGLNEHDANSCCSGVFQQNRRYWDGRRRRLNPHHGWKLAPSVYNARTNVVISLRMASRDGWGAWSCKG